MTPSRHFSVLFTVLCLLTLSGCDLIFEVLDIPNPEKETEAKIAEGKAIGGACRHSGRSLEDCYFLHPDALKSAVFAGWREMNDYMLQNNIESVPAKLAPEEPPAPKTPQTPPSASAPTPPSNGDSHGTATH